MGSIQGKIDIHRVVRAGMHVISVLTILLYWTMGRKQSKDMVKESLIIQVISMKR